MRDLWFVVGVMFDSYVNVLAVAREARRVARWEAIRLVRRFK